VLRNAKDFRRGTDPGLRLPAPSRPAKAQVGFDWDVRYVAGFDCRLLGSSARLPRWLRTRNRTIHGTAYVRLAQHGLPSFANAINGDLSPRTPTSSRRPCGFVRARLHLGFSGNRLEVEGQVVSIWAEDTVGASVSRLPSRTFSRGVSHSELRSFGEGMSYALRQRPIEATAQGEKANGSLLNYLRSETDDTHACFRAGAWCRASNTARGSGADAPQIRRSNFVGSASPLTTSV
jgi:hypothetical protein